MFFTSDTEPYKASCQSRFNTPELVAVFGDVVRRMRFLKGTRAAIGRKGFTADLKDIAAATSADFMDAMKISGPKESIGSAAARPEMPARVKIVLRTLSTPDVPGTGAENETALRPRQQPFRRAELFRHAKLRR